MLGSAPDEHANWQRHLLMRRKSTHKSPAATAIEAFIKELSINHHEARPLNGLSAAHGYDAQTQSDIEQIHGQDQMELWQ